MANEMISTICRLCMGTASIMKDIFANNMVTSIADKLMEMVQIEARPGDGYPKQICHRCYLQLNSAYSFKKRCLETQKKLTDLFFTKRNEDKKLHHCYTEATVLQVEQQLNRPLDAEKLKLKYVKKMFIDVSRKKKKVNSSVNESSQARHDGIDWDQAQLGKGALPKTTALTSNSSASAVSKVTRCVQPRADAVLSTITLERPSVIDTVLQTKTCPASTELLPRTYRPAVQVSAPIVASLPSNIPSVVSTSVAFKNNLMDTPNVATVGQVYLLPGLVLQPSLNWCEGSTPVHGPSCAASRTCPMPSESEPEASESGEVSSLPHRSIDSDGDDELFMCSKSLKKITDGSLCDDSSTLTAPSPQYLSDSSCNVDVSLNCNPDKPGHGSSVSVSEGDIRTPEIRPSFSFVNIKEAFGEFYPEDISPSALTDDLAHFVEHNYCIRMPITEMEENQHLSTWSGECMSNNARPSLKQTRPFDDTLSISGIRKKTKESGKSLMKASSCKRVHKSHSRRLDSVLKVQRNRPRNVSDCIKDTVNQIYKLTKWSQRYSERRNRALPPPEFVDVGKLDDQLTQYYDSLSNTVEPYVPSQTNEHETYHSDDDSDFTGFTTDTYSSESEEDEAITICTLRPKC